jgi:uncharacterized repeat protein (TIGR02543 family)
MKRRIFGLGVLALLAFGLVLAACDDLSGGETTYTVTFNANGGSSPSSQTVNAGSSATLPSTTRSGYTFNGWYTALSGGTKAGGAGDSYTPSSDVTLYAQWTQGGGGETTYTVTFNGNGGSSPSSQTVNVGSSTTLPSTTRSGYTLDGWYTASSGGTKAGNAGDSYTPSSDITLYAQWTQGGGGRTTGLYMGIIGFNENINPREISLLDNSTKGAFQSFVNAMTTRAGTVLYYAVENALNKLAQADLPDDMVNVSIVTFTDGLDQGSVMLNETYNGSNDAYLTAIGSRIQSLKIKNLDISAYSIGIKGNDVSDMGQFTANLNSIASSSANAYEVDSMSQVEAKFQDITNSLYNESSEQSIKLDIPGQANGTKVRFTFDNVNDAANSTLYIEGTYSFATKSLTNVVYQGCNSSSGTTVAGVQNGIFVGFSFAGLEQTSGNSVPVNTIKQWGQSSATTNWQINSEFAYDPDTVTTVERKSAVIILVLDCSSSLSASDFSSIKNSANSFINTLVQENSSGDSTTYTVSFNGNGGSSPSSQTVDAGSSTPLPSTTRSGYTFNGWYTASSGGTKAGDAGASYTPASDITLYAQWSQSGGGTTTYTVTFNANGGSSVSSQTVDAGDSLTLPSTTRSGYTFNGWYTASSGGTKAGDAGSSYTPTSSVTLYAQWAQSGGGTTTYTVTFNANGGSSVSSQTVNVGSSTTLPSTTQSGYTLDGWYTSLSGGTKAGNAGASYTPSSSVTLYAQWTQGGGGGTTYTVTFNGNNVTVTPPSATVNAGSPVTLPAPARTGYTLNGWYTTSSGGTKVGNAGASYTPTSSVTLYAQWAAKPPVPSITAIAFTPNEQGLRVTWSGSGGDIV